MTVQKRAPLLPLLLGLLFASVSTDATAQDLFQRKGFYDLTGSPLIRDRHLPAPNSVEQQVSFAERRGLAGAPRTEIRKNFFYVQDTESTLTIPYRSIDDLFESFNFALEEFYVTFPDEYQFVYLFTTFDTGVGAFFYQPEANDVRGIGSEVFDRNGRSPREGFVFMNWYKAFEETFGRGGPRFVNGQARSVFNQEAGHRWGSSTQVGTMGNGMGVDRLLGRDESHWNYFLHTGGSPMEGNSWRDNNNGTFTTDTGYDNWRFSDLDLYLMGLIPTTAVNPFFVITDPEVGRLEDLYGEALNPASPPQILDPVTVRGTREDITIDDVVGAVGARRPAQGASPTSWKAAFVLLASKEDGLTESQLKEFEAMVDDYADGFSEGARGLGKLEYGFEVPPRAAMGENCIEADDCDPTQATVCFMPREEANVGGMCTRSCEDGSGCPAGWCCNDAVTDGPVLCLPEGMCVVAEPPTPEPGVCGCDATTVCDANCDCDPECQAENEGPCLCDTTTICDKVPSENNAICTCDPECKAERGPNDGSSLVDDEKGCGCTETVSTNGVTSRRSAVAIATLAVVGLLFRSRSRRASTRRDGRQALNRG